MNLPYQISVVRPLSPDFWARPLDPSHIIRISRPIDFRLEIKKISEGYAFRYCCTESGCRYQLNSPRYDLMKKHAAKHPEVP